jgi:hypothetical protein
MTQLGTITGITMRNSFHCPLFLRLGRRMRLPAGRAYALDRVAKFRSFGSRSMPDVSFDDLQSRTI